MKKIFLAAIVAAIAMSMIPASAAHNARTVTATITAPTTNVGVGLLTRHARCNEVLGRPVGNDVVAHAEYLDIGEGDGTHTFTLSGAADFEIVFYASLGTCDNDPAPVVTGSFAKVGNEAGTIPAESTAALIVFTTPGADQAFSLSIS